MDEDNQGDTVVCYVGRNYNKYTAEFTDAVNSLTLPDPIPPVVPDPTNVMAFEMWKLEYQGSPF